MSRRAISWKVVATVAGICLSVTARATDSLWDSALAHADKSEWAAAEKAFREWERVTARPSPELHHNLALLHWKKQEPGLAVQQWLKKLQILPQPWRVLGDWQTLTRVQNQLGIKEGGAHSPLFLLFYLAHPNVWMGLLSLGFWSCVGWALLRWLKPVHALPALLFFGIFCLGLSVGAYSFRHLPTVPMVLENRNELVAIYSTPQCLPAEKIIDLPSGVAVLGKVRTETATEILSPVTGWVPNTQILEM